MKFLNITIVLLFLSLSLKAEVAIEVKLSHAIRKNNLEVVKTLIKEKPALTADYRSGDKNVILVLLAKGDYPEMLTFFISKGADVHFLGKDDRNALHYAASHKRSNCLKILIEKKVNIDQLSDRLFPPIVSAIIKGDLQAVKTLVEAGADIKSLVGERKLTVFRQAIKRKRDDIAIYLLEQKIDPKADLKSKNTSLPAFDAAGKNCPKVLEQLLLKGFDPNSTDRHKYTALFNAIAFRSTDCMKVLFKYGAKVDARSLKRAERSDNNKIINLIDKHK